MKLSTALKISGVCFLALVAESLLAFLIFSNYASILDNEGQFSFFMGSWTGPMATIARIFYGIFVITVAIGIGAPLLSLLSEVIQRRSKVQ